MLNIFRKWGQMRMVPTLGKQLPVYAFGKAHKDQHANEHHADQDHHDHHEIDR